MNSPSVPRIVIVVLILSVAWPVGAAKKKMSKADKRWLEEEVGALITEEERELFKDLQTGEERDVFKRIFWARRDPNLQSPENELKIDYDRRLRVANERFKMAGRRGAATDMGKLFLLLGAPQRAGSKTGPGAGLGSGEERDAGTRAPGRLVPGEEPASPTEMMGESMSSDESPFGERGRTQTWVYGPNEAFGISEELRVRFREQPGFGYYRLVRTKALNRVLERAKAHYIVRPEIAYEKDAQGRLVEPPRPEPAVERTETMVPVSRAEPILEGLRQTRHVVSDIGFHVAADFFRYREGSIFIPVLFDIDPRGLSWREDQADVLIAGLVEAEDGREAARFEEPALLTKDGEGKARFEIPLELEPGRYMVYMAVRDEASSTLGTKIQSLEVPDYAGDALEISSVLLFKEGRKVDEPIATAGQAFIVGSYHFVPKLDSVYRQTDRISGVFQAFGYGTTEEGRPDLTAQYIFLQEGVKRGQTEDEPFISASDKMAVTVFDMPLDAFAPGRYTLRIQVSDNVSAKKLTKDIAFEIQ